jgi:hypothetical protein
LSTEVVGNEFQLSIAIARFDFASRGFADGFRKSLVAAEPDGDAKSCFSAGCLSSDAVNDLIYFRADVLAIESFD